MLTWWRLSFSAVLGSRPSVWHESMNCTLEYHLLLVAVTCYKWGGNTTLVSEWLFYYVYFNLFLESSSQPVRRNFPRPGPQFTLADDVSHSHQFALELQHLKQVVWQAPNSLKLDLTLEYFNERALECTTEVMTSVLAMYVGWCMKRVIFLKLFGILTEMI